MHFQMTLNFNHSEKLLQSPLCFVDPSFQSKKHPSKAVLLLCAFQDLHNSLHQLPLHLAASEG